MLAPIAPNNNLTQLFLQDFEDFEDEIEDENAKLEADVKQESSALDQELRDFAIQNFGPGAQDYTDKECKSFINSAEYLDTLTEVRHKFSIQLDLLNAKNLKLDGELELIIKCLNLITTIDDKIHNLHRFAKDIYAEKFAELESLVNNPWEYANVVMRIQNKSDISKMDFSDF